MPLDIAKIQALCFDVDGTLSDTDNHIVLQLTHRLHPVGFLFPNRDPQPFARQMVMATESLGNIILNIPDKLSIDDELTALGNFIYRLGLGNITGQIQAVPGVEEALHRLQPHYPLSIVTNRSVRTTRIFLETFDLSKSFECVATAQTCAHSKPYPDPILWAAEKMGVHPDTCLMIGDTTIDIRAGIAAGAQTIGVLCGFGEEDELHRAGADLILSSTTDLPALLLDSVP